jgi:hypothetical protein
MRREQARELAKELLNNQPAKSKRGWDAGWFLAAFLALALLLIAPKVGRPATVVVLLLMVGCLVPPLRNLRFIREAPTVFSREMRFVLCLLVGVLVVGFLGVYVWPPIKRHTLSPQEQEGFVEALKATHGGDPISQVQLLCPPDDEKTCIYARQFIGLFGRAEWPIQTYVQRVTLSGATEGITVFRRAGNKEDMMKRWNSGGWVEINEAHLLAVHSAFQTIHISIESGANPDVAENVMAIYFGPERDDESQPTGLTQSINKWVHSTK